MRKLLLLSLLSLLPSVAGASDLTWTDVWNSAVANNPDLRAAHDALAASRARFNGSLNGLYPRLGLQNRYTRSDGDGGDGIWSAAATADVTLFDLSSFSSINAASASVARAEAVWNLQASTVLFNLRQAFANLLFAQQQVSVAAAVRSIRDRDARMVTLRYNSGRESKGNMMRAKAELLDADRAVSQARRSVRAAQQSLGEQLGQDRFEALTATGTLSIAPPATTVPANIADLAEGHPSVTVARADLAAAETGIARARSGLWPTLSAAYTRSFTGASEFPTDPGWTATGVLNYPLFAGGPTAVYNDLKASRRSADSARESLRSARNAARSELETAWANLAAASEQIDVESTFLDAARQRNAEADIRYSNGLMSYEDWERIVTERVNFEQSLVRAQRDAVVAEAAWDRAAGKGLNK